MAGTRKPEIQAFLAAFAGTLSGAAIAVCVILLAQLG
jgi:hypothetical protein